MKIETEITISEHVSEKDGRVIRLSREEIKREIEAFEKHLSLIVIHKRDDYDKTYDSNKFKYDEAKLLEGDKKQLQYVVGMLHGLDRPTKVPFNLLEIVDLDIRGNMIVSSNVTDNCFSFEVYKYLIEHHVEQPNKLGKTKDHILTWILMALLRHNKIDLSTYVKEEHAQPGYMCMQIEETGTFCGYTADECMKYLIAN